MNTEPDLVRFLERQLTAQAKHSLRTNAIVKLAMRQPPRVNSKPIKLGQHARIILLLLAARAIESPGDYFKTEEILRELTRRERILGALHLSWVKPTEAQLHSAISELRQALEDCGLDRNLIESVHGKGYRLSTPAMNILGDDSAPDNLPALLPLFPQHGLGRNGHSDRHP